MPVIASEESPWLLLDAGLCLTVTHSPCLPGPYQGARFFYMRLPVRLAYSLLPLRPFALLPSHPRLLSRSRAATARSPQAFTPRSYATVMSSVKRITDNLEKPDLDDRSYRVIELSNKLEALLVHDAQTDKASASLNVDVGNFSDEEDMPGMAHAVEHLLFMGTEKVNSEPFNHLTISHADRVNSIP